MNTRKTLMALMIGFLLTTSTLATRGQGASPEKRPQPDASCLTKISCKSNIIPLSESSFRALLYSTSILGDAVHNVLGVPPNTANEHISVGYSLVESINQAQGQNIGSQVYEQIQIYKLTLTISQEKVGSEKAQELLNAICELIQQQLEQVYQGHIEQLRQSELVPARERQMQAQQYLTETRNLDRALLQKAGRSDLQRDHILEEKRNLEQQRQHLEMQLIGLNARREAMKMQMAIMQRKFQQAIQNDSLQQELQNFIVQQEQKIQKMSPTRENEVHILQAKEQLLEKRIQFAQQKEMLKKSLGAEKIEQWNHELADMAIETAQIEAQLQHTREQLANHRTDEMLELANRYEMEVRSRIDAINETYQRASQQVDVIEQQIQFAQPPAVVIIGG